MAVIKGSNPGWVFVDDPNAPRAALVWAQGIDGFYLVGDANRTVFRDEPDFYTDQVLKPRLRSLGVAWFEIGGDKDWEPVIKDALGKRELETSRQSAAIVTIAPARPVLRHPRACRGAESKGQRRRPPEAPPVAPADSP